MRFGTEDVSRLSSKSQGTLRTIYNFSLHLLVSLGVLVVRYGTLSTQFLKGDVLFLRTGEVTEEKLTQMIAHVLPLKSLKTRRRAEQLWREGCGGERRR